MRKISIFHARDAEMFRVGGLFAGRRFFNDPPKDPPPPADWRTALPEDLRESPALKDVKDVAGLAKRFVDTQARVGASIYVPKDATPEQRTAALGRVREVFPDLVEIPKDPEKRKEAEAAYWDLLGRPKDEAGYKVDGVQFEEGVSFTPEELAAARKQAKEDGLTAAQFAAQLNRAGQARAAALKAQKALNAELRAEFGAAYDDRMKTIAAVAEATGAPQSLREAIAKGQVDKGTAVYLLNIQKQLGTETREITTQKRGASGLMTPTEAEAEIPLVISKLSDPKTSADEKKRLSDRLVQLERYASPALAAQSGA